MPKFDITVETKITKRIEVEAVDYEEAIDKVKRMFQDGILHETYGWVTVTADDDAHETWHEIGQYERR